MIETSENPPENPYKGKMASNLDILDFLKSEKVARAKEKEEEKQARAKEREEDMKLISSLIQTGVQEEVVAAMEPVKEKLEGQEKVTKELSLQLTNIMQEVEVLKKTVNNQNQSSSTADLSGTSQMAWGRQMGRPSTRSGELSMVEDRSNRDMDDYRRRVGELCGMARKVVGFKPIEPRMMEIQMRSYGAENWENAMLMEIKSYLKCEMKILPSEIEKLDIVRIFASPKEEEWNVLYVEFGSEYQVDKVFSYIRGMVKKDHQLVRWFPRQMKERKNALEKRAFEIRDADRVNLTNTRVKVGRDDLEWYTRQPNSKVWRRQPLPDNLPDFDLDFTTSPAKTTSPPPGRPGRNDLLAADNKEDERKRQMSPDSDRDEDDAVKKAKLSMQKDGLEGNQDGIESDIREDFNIGSGKEPNLLDLGKFTNQEGYSPSTPAKAKSIPDLSIIMNSPVYHTKSGKGAQ